MTVLDMPRLRNKPHIQVDTVLAIIVLGLGFIGFAYWFAESPQDWRACGTNTITQEPICRTT